VKLLMIGTSLVLCAGVGRTVPPEITDPTDRQILEAFLAHAEAAGARCTPERMAEFASQPEDIVWVASQYVRMPLVAYRLTEETKYLDMFVERMDNLCSCLSEGPDGFLGWYGLPLELFRHPDHPERKVDVMLTGYEMTGLMAEFARVVKADGDLVARYGGAAKRYLDIAENHLIRKWDERGNYKELGTTGAVNITRADLKPVKAHLTQPHNKHAKFVGAMIDLYAATGRSAYLAKAIRFGTRFKRCLTLVDDRYSWDYLDPAGAWDVHPDDPAKWKHWIGSEHRGGYYNLTLSQAVLLYEHGLVFDETDMERFVATQMQVCWNGDTEDPKWARVDGQEMDSQYLCGWLAPFDERIYEMAYGAPGQRTRLENKDHPWQGGVVACGWLEFKYLTFPRWRSGEPAEVDVIAPFLAEPDGGRLVLELGFDVVEPSYHAPATPAEMTPMPGMDE